MDNECIEAIKSAYQCGQLNPYMVKKLLSAAEAGMSKSLAEDLINDGQAASDAGVNSDRDYNVYFFIGRFSDDILDDTFGMKIDADRKKDLHHYIMSHKDDETYKLDDLTDHRLLIHKWLCDRLSKQAYPNTQGKEERGPMYKVDKWIGTLKKIYAVLHLKKSTRGDAIDHFTSGWDQDERQQFITWMRYYEDGTTEKYNVKTAKFVKEAFGSDMPLPSAWMNVDDRASDGMKMSTLKQKREQTRREKELDKAKAFKSKMRSRLRSFKRLLERYNDILSKQDLDKVYDELYSLEKSVSRLNVYSSLQDCVIRSANRLNKFGFTEGAEFLHKCAVEPAALAPQPMPDMPPQGSSGVQPIISKLEETSKALKSRDMIRELANIDILLNELGMASYFPEISFAQSKLIEAFGYASSKIEDIVAKLRGGGGGGSGPSKGGGTDQSDQWGSYKRRPGKSTRKAPPLHTPAPAVPQPPPPPSEKPIDTGELLNKPVTKVKEKLPTG